jgi:hypothetical protein
MILAVHDLLPRGTGFQPVHLSFYIPEGLKALSAQLRPAEPGEKNVKNVHKRLPRQLVHQNSLLSAH